MDVKTSGIATLTSRCDQIGANFTSYIAQCVALDVIGVKTQATEIKYSNSKIVKPLLKLFPKQDLKAEHNSAYSHDWLETNSKAVLLANSDCISYFNNKWRAQYLSELKVLFGNNDPWKQYKKTADSKILCIHMRLGM